MTTDLTQEQTRIEEMMRGMTMTRFNETLAERRKRGEESATFYGNAMIKRTVAPLMEAIEAFIAQAKAGGGGRRHVAVKLLEQVPVDVAAYLTSKVILDQITQNAKLQRAALTVGNQLEDELRYAAFQEKAPGLWAKISKDMAGDTDRRRRTVFILAYNRFIGDWKGWSQTDKVHLGMKLIEMFQEATGFCEVTTRNEGKNKTLLYLTATEAVLDWIEGNREGAALMTPVFLPMVVEPLPWTRPTGGGYITTNVRPLTLIKTRNRNYLTELSSMGDQLADVYAAVNSLQAVRWAINPTVHETMLAMWEQGTAAAGLPPREALPLPPSPLATDRDTSTLTDEERAVFKAWKLKASEVHSYNMKLKSRRMQIGKVLSIAQMFKEYDAFYFPYTLDFRGRVYAVPMFLNPQGSDHAKGLLQFAEGKPLGSTNAAGWLAIHGANTFGFDKVDFDERMDWVAERSDRIEAIGNDPLSDLWWTEADKPWAFLAFCVEWAGYLREGLDFVSHLPIAMDGSCSGLQHFSAALRDEVGGAAVNLTPSPKPADVYQTVLDKALVKISADLPTGGKEAELAQLCLDFGLSRKTTKRATMTVPYGSTRYSSRAFVGEYFTEAEESRREQDPSYVNPLGDRQFDASMYLSGHVWEAIGETVIAARSAMDWLRGCASVLAKEKLPVNWTTPDGLPILQAYADVTHRRVKTRFGNQLIYLTLVEEKDDKIDARRQQNGVAPNWVHSMDGTHLRMAVNLAKHNGVDNFAVVHDSFGTHACDTDMLAACLRETFVELYETDVLQCFADEVSDMLSEGAELPPVPAKGSLDLNLVRESDFIFA